MIDDNTDARMLLKKFDHNPKAYFLYSPAGHYQNANALYAAIKKQLTKKYYGSATKGSEGEHSFKGTAFNKLSTPYDVFHMQRRTKLTIR